MFRDGPRGDQEWDESFVAEWGGLALVVQEVEAQAQRAHLVEAKRRLDRVVVEARRAFRPGHVGPQLGHPGVCPVTVRGQMEVERTSQGAAHHILVVLERDVFVDGLLHVGRGLRTASELLTVSERAQADAG